MRPGSVQSTDGSTIRIPGPLADGGRDGMVLTYDEDLHQPVWSAPASGGATWADAYSSTVRDNGSGYPSFADWTFFDDDAGQIGMTSASDANGTIFDVPAGLYMAKITLSINVTSPQADFSMSCNIHSPSAFVTHEFPVNLHGTSYHSASYTIGPLPALEGQGRMSVSFYYPTSPGVPVLSGSCTYILAKLA